MPTSVTPFNTARWQPVHDDCLELEFTITDFEQQAGVLATALIPAAIFSSVIVGTQFEINGVIFTAIGAAPATSFNNEFDVSGTAIQGRNNFLVAVNTSYLSGTQLSSATANATGVTLVGYDCTISIDISITNLSTADQQISAAPTPLLIKNNFSICAKFEKVDDLLNVIDDSLPEIQIIPKVIVSADKCTVESVTAKKAVGCILSQCVTTPIPDCTINAIPLAIERPEMTARLSLSFSEAYGNPVNFYGRNGSQDFMQIFNATNTCDTEFDYEGTDVISFVNVTGNNVRCGQSNRLYVGTQQHDSIFIEMEVTITNKNGASLTAPFSVIYNGDLPKGIFEIQTGLRQVAGLFGFTFDFSDVASYTVAVRTTETVPNQTRTFTVIYNIVDRIGDYNEFVFLTSRGTFETMTTRAFTRSQLNILSTVIDTCKPCMPNTSTRYRQPLRVEQFRDFVTFIEKDLYDEDLITEFLGSTEIYFGYNGNTYWVEPLTSVAQDVRSGCPVDIPFRFRICSHENFVQC